MRSPILIAAIVIITFVAAKGPASAQHDFGVEIRGRFVDDETRPVAKIEVRLERPHDPGFHFFGLEKPGFDLIQRTRSDAEGRFVFRGIDPEHKYVLHIASPPYAPYRRSLDRLEFPVPAELGAIRLKRGAIVSGVAVDGRGQPVSGTSVQIIAADLQTAWGEAGLAQAGPAVARSDANGRFQIEGVHIGEVILVGTKAGWVLTQSDRIQTRPGMEAAGVRLTLVKGKVISGTVVDPTGTPIANIDVLADAENAVPVETKSGAGGRFRLEGLSDGLYTVSAWRSDASAASVEAEAGTEGVRIVFIPKEPLRVHGRVVRREDGKPVAGARIWIATDFELGTGSLGEPDAMTNKDGRFLAIVDRQSRERQVVALAEGYAEGRSATFHLRPEESPPKTLLHLDRPGAIAGIVVAAASDRPVAGALVAVWRELGKDDMYGLIQYLSGGGQIPSLQRVLTDAAGRFRLGGLPPGRFKLEVRAANFAAARVHGIEVAAGHDSAPVRVALGRGGILTGKVVWEVGKPVPGITVILTDEGHREMRRTTDAEGAFRFAQLPTGEYTVRLDEPGVKRTFFPFPSPAWPNRKRPGGRVLKIVEGSHVTHTFTVKRDVTVSGQVTEAGLPVHGCMVTFRPEAARGAPTADLNPARDVYHMSRIDRNGRYQLKNVKPGRYRICVSIAEPHAHYDALTRTVEVPRTATFNIDLDLPGGRIEGHVFCPAEDGFPQPRLCLQLADTELLIRSITARKDGAFEFRHLSPGTYHISVLRTQHWAAALVMGIAVALDEPVKSIDLRLHKGITVEGVVVHSDNRPVADALIYVTAAGEKSLGIHLFCPPTISGRDGTFKTVRLAPGEYAFRAVYRGNKGKTVWGNPVKVLVGSVGKVTGVRLYVVTDSG